MWSAKDFTDTNKSGIPKHVKSDDVLVHGKIRGGEYHEGRIRGLTMEVRVSILLMGLLSVLSFAAPICKWRRQHM
jgi:hypothetical protein